jgi:predicted CXXCH cytochrome family protein
MEPVAASDSYVDNQRCLDCHQEQAALWQQSHHAKSMAVATEQTVLGNFNNAEFRHQGITSRFFRQGDKYFVKTDGPDGKLADFEIGYTFGVAPLQQYLIALPGGRLQALQIAWDDVRKRWFHLQPKEKAPAGDVLHWSGNYQTANTLCIECHTTGFEKRFDATTGTFDSRWTEINVSCQACHGPGERHLAWARLRKEGKTFADAPGERFGLTEATKQANARLQVDVCAACHARRSVLSAKPQPGQPRLDHYLPLQLAAGHYYPDGQQLGEVFVDGSYRQSKMYQAGVACTACHNAHTGKLTQPGNAVCVQCHAPTANVQFPTAQGTYDTPAHHHHKAGGTGAACAACHMPSRTYMQIQPRPDHSLRIPRPDLTGKIGTPNACNGCHADKSAAWAAEQLRAWGPGKPRVDPHYGEIFAKARAGRPDAAPALAELAGDARYNAIVRATALSALSGEGVAGMAVRIKATRDPDPEVRASAADSLDVAAPQQRIDALAPLLRDPVLAVRMAAARSLSSLPNDRIGEANRPAFDAAIAEFVAAQSHSLDMPGAHLNLAVVVANIGRMPLAEQHYRAALKIDLDFTPARANLATLFNATARNADALAVLTEGLQRRPQIGELQYSLGLLLAEENRLPEAVAALEQAARLMPKRPRVHYNLGLALQKTERLTHAASALEAAFALNMQDAAPAQALAILFAQRGDRTKALRWAQTWVALAPSDPRAQRLLAQIQVDSTR